MIDLILGIVTAVWQLQYITFQQRRIWHFVPEMSNGSLDDSVTSLNIPLVV